MALIVETGEIVPNADTYVSRADYITYAAKQGVTIPDVDASDYQLIKAMSYLDTYNTRWRGRPTDNEQFLAFPRVGLYYGISNDVYPNNKIPRDIIRAQMELALQVNAGVELTPTVSGSTAFVTREKVDVIETEYSEAVALRLLGQLPSFPLVDALLAPFLAGGMGFLKTRRM